MSAVVLRADARQLPLPDASVDLIVTSPPYFALRSYKDGGEHYDGQIGSEPHPREFLEALWAVTAECWRVLKPTGSMWVNLGDKRSGSSAPGTTSGLAGKPQGARTGMTSPTSNEAREQLRRERRAGTFQQERVKSREHAIVRARDERRSLAGRSGPDTRDVARDDIRSTHEGDLERSGDSRAEWTTRMYTQASFGRAKSKMLLPHRYAIGCEDGLADPDGIGWIVRQDQVWSKLNGLPESVRDRTRDSHEYWFHLCKRGDYFASIDEIREPHAAKTTSDRRHGSAPEMPSDIGATGNGRGVGWLTGGGNPLGKVPGSVKGVATEPLIVPEHLGVDHFAAFPSEWPRWIINGWSPNSICTSCETPRAPVVVREQEQYRDAGATGRSKRIDGRGEHRSGSGVNDPGYPQTISTTTITGYACACPDDSAPTRAAVVLDPFGGTGTTAMVAHALGRHGISVDLSADYCRLARWRIFESGSAAKARARTNRDRQGVLL